MVKAVAGPTMRMATRSLRFLMGVTSCHCCAHIGTVSAMDKAAVKEERRMDIRYKGAADGRVNGCGTHPSLAGSITGA